ncbi:MAG: hypothetical protein OEW33_02585 [Nitrospirota bacterium]|nr:hypothetical protein [Nitrospirota bacterium]
MEVHPLCNGMGVIWYTKLRIVEIFIIFLQVQADGLIDGVLILFPPSWGQHTLGIDGTKSRP